MRFVTHPRLFVQMKLEIRNEKSEQEVPLLLSVYKLRTCDELVDQSTAFVPNLVGGWREEQQLNRVGIGIVQ